MTHIHICNADYGARTYLYACLPPPPQIFTSTILQLGECSLRGATMAGAEAEYFDNLKSVHCWKNAVHSL